MRAFVEMSDADTIRDGASLIGGGIVVGLAVGAWASRFVATLLYGLEPGDPGTLIASAATLALIGAVDGWLPANRASRLEPTRDLRDAWCAAHRNAGGALAAWRRIFRPSACHVGGHRGAAANHASNPIPCRISAGSPYAST